MNLVTHTLRAARSAPSLLFALALLAGSASAQSVELPATFEEDIDYELSDFGGAVSSLVTDPMDDDNTAVQTVRGAAAECFAGTTLASTTGFSEPIPLAPGAATMSVRVWSPEAGVRVRFKPENRTNPEVFVEADAFTTAAMQWETLVFDFAGQSLSSADRQFTKASIFFDFQCGVAGITPAAERTYYWDDVAFGNGGGASGDQTAIVINEVDADTPGTDAAEFVEFYNPSSEAVSLDGLVAVFFNGSNDQSYAAYDLTGSLAAGGYYVLGNPGVPNVNQTFDPGGSGFLQNGPDAVALYAGSAATFPNSTDATTTNLIDAVVYDTDDSDDAGLLAALGQTIQYNEAANGDKDNQSVQRSPDGDDSFVTALATPGAANAVITGPQTFTALLRGENEVPPVDTDAKGGVTLVLEGTTLTVSGSFAGLQSDYDTNIGSHIHGGAANENKPVVIPLVPTLNGDLRGGSWSAANNTFTIRPSFADSVRAGLAYVNVHSVSNPGGEIRGQIGTEAQALPFALSGASEVPPNASPATGSGTVTLDASTVTVTGSFSGLTGDYRMSHIHAGAAGANGPVVQGLAPTVATDMRGGSWEAATNTFTVRATFADSIRAGLAYVNVHSSAFPGGEVRGQIGTAAPLVTVTIAEARAQGAGATVQVQGVVTRSMGAFTYFQDATAGLTIRQTSGEFFDAVAGGIFEPGTQIEVTGTISEFNQLLQINGSDLESYRVVGTTDVPVPQEVTLAQLAANGEAYEAELVTVSGVAFTDTGAFAARKAYMISDASSMTSPVVAYVPSANDTSVDETSIPAQANLTGIVGQFNATDPAAGYQLLLIDAGDIENTVANEDDARAGAVLAVANPLRGAATVRFSLGAPGRAQVALYDALGRQVALLADGTFDAAVQTVTVEAGRLASGVYVLRLQGEDTSLTRTVTVVR